MTDMRVIELTAHGGLDGFRAATRPVPEPGPHEVRIRLAAAAFNPVDYKLRQGRFGGELPVVLGQDLAGRVDAVGPGVTEHAIGDAVVAYLGGPGSNGSYAEYVCVPVAFVAAAPRNLDPCQAAALPLVGLTAWESVMERPRPAPDQPVVVFGASGGVGTLAVRLLRHLGVTRILATFGGAASRAYLIDELGFAETDLIPYRGLPADAIAARLIEATDGLGAAFVYDFVGGAMKEAAAECLAINGRLVTIVEEPQDPYPELWNGRESPFFHHSAAIEFQFLGARALFGVPQVWPVYRRELRALIALVDEGAVAPPRAIVVGPLAVATVAEAHRRMEAGGGGGKLVMQISDF